MSGRHVDSVTWVPDHRPLVRLCRGRSIAMPKTASDSTLKPRSKPAVKPASSTVAKPPAVSVPHDSTAGRRAIIIRLRRIEGQLRGIQTLIESGAGCEEVAQQMAASRAALDRAFFAMMSCAIEEAIDGAPSEQVSQRLAAVNGVLMRFG